MTVSSTASDHDRPPPAQFAFGSHTWKEIAHLLCNLPVSLVGFVYVTLLIFNGVLLSVTVIGLPLLALGLMGARGLGRAERARTRALLGVRIDEPSTLSGMHRGGGVFPACGRP